MKPIQAVIAIALNIDLNGDKKLIIYYMLRYMKPSTKLGIDKDFGL